MPDTPKPALESDPFRFDAFISYRHVEPDRGWATWLHNALETYRVPKELVAKGFPKRLTRVFRDEEELPANSDLSKEITNALEQSKFLIVVCSPRTVESHWVNAEVEYFRGLGRHDRILALLIEGEPGKSFPPALTAIRRAITDESSGQTREVIEQVEPLAADVRPERADIKRHVLRRHAQLRLMACILGCRFDDLRQRELERGRRRERVALAIVGIIAACLAGLSAVALLERSNAITQRALAESKASAEIANAARAQRNADLAQEQRRRAEIESYFGNLIAAQSAIETDNPAVARERLEACPPHLRAWEWHALIASTDESAAQFELPAPLEPDRSAAASISPFRPTVSTPAQLPDGTWVLACVDSGGRVRIGDPTSSTTFGYVEELQSADELKLSASGAALVASTHAQTLFAIDPAFRRVTGTIPTPDRVAGVELELDRDGRTVAYAGKGGVLKVHALPRGEEVANVQARLANGRVWLSPGGRTALVTGAREATLWDLSTPRGTALVKFPGRCTQACFSPDDAFIAAASEPVQTTSGPNGMMVRTEADGPKEVKVWDCRTGELAFVLEGHALSIMSIAWSPNGQLIATGSADRSVRVWEASRPGKLLKVLLAGGDGADRLAFNGEARLLFASSPNGTGRVWDVQSGEVVTALRGHQGPVLAGVFDSKRRRLVTAASDRFVRTWDLDRRWPLTLEPKLARAPLTVSLNADSSLLVTASGDKDATVWFARDGRMSCKLAGHTAPVTYARFSPTESRIVTASFDGTVRVWDLQHPDQPLLLSGHKQAVFAAEFSPDGRRIATACPLDGLIRVWDADSARQLNELIPGRSIQFQSVAWSADGVMIAASGGGWITIWNASKGTVIREWRAVDTTLSIMPLAFDPQGRWIAVGSQKDVRLWDLRDGNELKVISGALAPVRRIGVLARGERIATAESGGAVRLFDTASGRQVAALEDTPTGSLDISLDESLIAVGQADGRIGFWDTQPWRVRAKSLGRAGSR